MLHCASLLGLCVYLLFFFLLIPRPPTSTLFPYTTLFRSYFRQEFAIRDLLGGRGSRRAPHGIPEYSNEKQIPEQARSEEHTSELQSPDHLVCRLLLEKKKRRDRCRLTKWPTPSYIDERAR